MINLRFWKNDNILLEDKKNKTHFETITSHLKSLEENTRKRADKISDTIGLIENLTDEAQTYQAVLSKERDIWKATFDSMPSFIILLDLNYKIVRVNRSFISYIGINENFIIGKDCREILGKNICNCSSYCPVRDENNNSKLIDFKNIETMNGRHFSISYSPVISSVNKITGHVILLYDITDRVNLQKTMQLRDSILTAINETTEKMLRDFKPTNGHRIDDMIKNIGLAAQVSRVYVFNVGITDNIVSQTHEWVNNGIKSQIDNQLLQNFDMSLDFDRWLNAFKSKNIIHGLVKDFPIHEQQILLDQDIKSILLVPIFIHNKFTGFIGCDECTKERVWQEPEINALKMAANILSAWIERGKVEKNLRRIIDDHELKVKRLGEYLVEDGYITRDKLKEILIKQKNDLL